MGKNLWKAEAAVDSDNVADLPSSGEGDSSELDDLSLARCTPLVSVSTRTASLGRRFAIMVGARTDLTCFRPGALASLYPGTSSERSNWFDGVFIFSQIREYPSG
ncbi:MAG: hypothetical protein ACTHNH_05480 [Mesorhizobium sp.]